MSIDDTPTLAGVHHGRLNVRSHLAAQLADANVITSCVMADATAAEFPSREALAAFLAELQAAKRSLVAGQVTLQNLVITGA